MSMPRFIYTKTKKTPHHPPCSCTLAAEDATHESFMMKRHRHSSVPQTARPMGQPAAGRRRNIPPGKLMSVRLNKTQIDKVIATFPHPIIPHPCQLLNNGRIK